MRSALAALVLAACWLGEAKAAEKTASFLYQPAYEIDHLLRLPVQEYQPQPGDLFFAVTPSFFMRWGHRLAGAAAPHHSGIVFARPDGSLAVLEAGPLNELFVSGWDALEHLRTYHALERLWIRRQRAPLTPEQSAKLTAFCMAQVGKPFATWRIVGQLTPFRSRGPLRTEYVGKPHGDRDNWFCAELVVESLCAAGLLDPATARPAATYPRDLFYDRSPNPWLNEYLNLSRDWYPPARWTDDPAATPRREYRDW